MNTASETPMRPVDPPVIDRESRDRLASGIEDVLSSRKTFWGSWRSIGSLRSRDPAIDGIRDFLATDLDDSWPPHEQAKRFPPETSEKWRRAVEFLRTDRPYAWPVRDARRWGRTLLVLAALLAAGLVGTFAVA
jgi:hypothetical protein